MLACFIGNAFSEEKPILLPELGSPNRASFSNQQEDVLSLAFLEALYQQADIIDDPELNSYIRDIGARLLRHVSTNRKFQFYIIKDNSINAFAGPGGIIALHSGLILAAKNEDEMAAVMAHEIQHVQQEHLSRMFEQGKKGMAATVAGIVGALLVGSQSPQAAMAMITGGIAYNAQQQLAFSRDNEWEADRTGIDVLAAAGYNPNAMSDFFETLASRYRNDSKAPEMLMSHPVTNKRISDSRARARMISYTKKTHEHTLALAQARLQALIGQKITATNPQLACYQQYLVANLQRNNAPMPSCHNLPEHLWSKIILLEMKAPLDQLGWQALSDIYPQNSAVLLNYADQLLLTHQSEKVVQLLTPVADQFNERWEFWKRIAQAWNQQNDNASEAFAMAKAYSSIGALKLAEIQIDRAKKSADASNNIQLNTQRESLENWLKIQLKARKEL